MGRPVRAGRHCRQPAEDDLGRCVAGAGRFPEVVAAYKTIGYEAPNLSPPQFDALIRRETSQWSRIIQAAHLRLD